MRSRPLFHLFAVFVAHPTDATFNLNINDTCVDNDADRALRQRKEEKREKERKEKKKGSALLLPG